MMLHIENKRLPWQYLIAMVIDKICKMTVKGQEVSFQYLMAFWIYGGNPDWGGGGVAEFRPLGLDRVKNICLTLR